MLTLFLVDDHEMVWQTQAAVLVTQLGDRSRAAPRCN